MYIYIERQPRNTENFELLARLTTNRSIYFVCLLTLFVQTQLRRSISDVGGKAYAFRSTCGARHCVPHPVPCKHRRIGLPNHATWWSAHSGQIVHKKSVSIFSFLKSLPRGYWNKRGRFQGARRGAETHATPSPVVNPPSSILHSFRVFPTPCNQWVDSMKPHPQLTVRYRFSHFFCLLLCFRVCQYVTSCVLKPTIPAWIKPEGAFKGLCGGCCYIKCT